MALEALDDSSSEKPSPVEQVPPINGADTNERKDGEACTTLEGLKLADSLSTDASGGFDEQERNAVFAEALLSDGGHDNSGKQAGHGGGWEYAVGWLLRCPDDRGVFRKIVGFL